MMGKVIAGKYRVEGSLGSGGMGAVWAVVEESTGMRMALKRLDRVVAAKFPHSTGLFEREYHVLKQLSHPCIVEAYDYGVDEEGPYYTMEALDGEGLHQLVPMQWRGVCKMVREMASSLAILHSRGLLHRDVNHRNVRYDTSGRAKLLDFGALTGFGIPANIVGMAPFMPPETIRRQRLLPNSDIYSLGCLTYWALTRRHPYRVKHPRELETIWKRPLSPPSSLVAEIPPQLDELVMAMLSLDPMLRPQTAREVIERVVAIADLPPGDPLNVASGYLRDPALVARATEIARMERLLHRGLVAPTDQVAAAATGRFIPVSARDTSEPDAKPAMDQSVLVVRGAAGSGRSRMLQELALLAALSGARVARASGRSTGDGPYSMVRDLVEHLLTEEPELKEGLAQTDNRALLPMLGIASSVHSVSSATTPSALQARFVDWLAEVAQPRGLVVVIDDLEDADEPSREAMLSLAARAPSARMVFAASLLLSDELRGDELDDLPHDATLIDLQPLSREHTTELVSSLFGEVENTAAVAHWIHSICAGNPEQCMQLARHLVDTKVARYAAGRWVLPAEIDPSDLPRDFGAAVTAALEHLSPGALSLARALSLHGDAPALELAVRLAPHGADGYALLAELTASGVVEDDGERCKPAHARLHGPLLSTLSAVDRASLHLHVAHTMADAATAPVDTLRAAYHFVRGGDLPAAAECSLPLMNDWAAVYEAGPRVVVTLKALLAFAVEDDRAGLRQIVRCQLLRCTQRYDRSLISHASAALDDLLDATGLRHADEYDASLSANERASRAIAAQIERRKPLPPHQRPMHPVPAVTALVSAGLCAIGGFTTLEDSKNLARTVEVMRHLGGLTPVTDFAYKTALACVQLIDGEFQRASDLFKEVAQGLDAEITRVPPEHVQALTDWRMRAWATCGHMSLGDPDELLRIADRLESGGAMLDAWRMRGNAFLEMADLPRYRAAQRRIETCERQYITLWEMGSWYLTRRAALQIALHDTDGLRATKSLLERALDVQPEFWAAVEATAIAVQLDEGDLEGAVQCGAEAIHDPRHTTHLPRSLLAAVYGTALLHAGRYADAREYAELILDDQQLTRSHMLRACAMAGLGEHAQAREALSTIRTGLSPGRKTGRMQLELQAGRAMVLMGDRAGFERCMADLDELILDTGCATIAVAQRKLRAFAVQHT